METPCKIIQLQPEAYDKCGGVFDDGQPHAMLWREQIENGDRIRFFYIENGNYLAQCDLVTNYGSRNINDETDYTIAGRRVYLSRLEVNDGERRKGIGRKMVDFVCETARKWGYEEISVGVNLDNVIAKHLYDKAGFTTVIYSGEDKHGKFEKLLKIL